MKIYFAHPKDTYNTEYELNCLDKIKELYPGSEILNPRDISIEEKDKSPKNYVEFMRQMNKYYLPAIKTCSLIVVAKTKRGKISPGVQKEIPYAKSMNVSIEYLDVPFPEPNRPTLTCYFCGIQFIVGNNDIAPEEEWTKHNRAYDSEYSLKDEDGFWRDSCKSCNGIDIFAMSCKYYDKCSHGKIEIEDCPKICAYSQYSQQEDMTE